MRVKCLPIFLMLCSFAAHAQPVTVVTTEGIIEGDVSDDMHRFLGIPYAQPPTGDLRWRPPVPPEEYEGIRSAKRFASACPQKTYNQGDPDAFEIIGDEDCLYLNVWTPDPDASLPVLFFIHGGGNQQGSSSEKAFDTTIYDGAALAERGNVVVVSINYRLGPLGYLVHEGLDAESDSGTSGNYGILDQIQALKWFRANATAFGGDVSRLMIFGESAGAVNTFTLLASPLAAGLFSRALAQSGAPRTATMEEMRERSSGLVAELDLEATGPAEELVELRSLAPERFIELLESPFSSGIAGPGWGPFVDGYVLPDEPLDIYERGEHNHVPMIIGSNADESALTAPALVTPSLYRAFVRSVLDAPLDAEALGLYPAGDTNSEARDAYVQLLTDAQFTRSARTSVRAIAAGQAEPVYQYFFAHRLRGIWEQYGSFHGLELFFVFQSLENSSYSFLGIVPAADRAVMEIMGDVWSRFAETGDPNGSNLPFWPQFITGEEVYLEIREDPVTGTFLRREKLDFWDRVFESARETAIAEDAYRTAAPTGRLSVYPNPTTGPAVISYDFQGPGSAPISVTICDMLGRHVRKLDRRQHDTGPGLIFWDGLDDTRRRTSSGTYIVVVQTAAGIRSRPLVISRESF